MLKLEIIFAVLIVVMLLLDLWVFNKKNHEIKSKEALARSLVWIGLAMLFSGYIYWELGFERFSYFQSAYWVEKLLSVDNLFVFIMVFGFFKVPKKLQHKVLFRGIIWALIFRAIFIFAGVKLIELTYLPEFLLFDHPVKINLLLTIFWGFLIYAGIKSFFAKHEHEENKNFSDSAGARVVKYFFPRVTDAFEWGKFFVFQNGLRYATPLLIVVWVIEFTDLLFAVDSIPAIFAIAPNDPFILYSSNIFAILGLRSLYFLLANFIDRFKYLSYGIAIILTFIGTKMLISPLFHIPAKISLIVLLSVLVLSVIVSLCMTPAHHQEKLTELKENN